MKPRCLRRYAIEVQWWFVHQVAEVVHPDPSSSDAPVRVLGEGVDLFVRANVALVDLGDDLLACCFSGS